MKTYAFYGLGAAFLGLLLNAVLFFAGLHSDTGRLAAAAWIGGLGGLAISIVMTTLAVREVRAAKDPAEPFSYAEGFKAALLVALFAAVGAVVSNYVYTQVINPAFNDLQTQAQIEKMRQQGVPEANISAGVELAKKFQHPAIAGAFAFIGTIVFGVILGLIIPIFTIRKPSTAEVAPPPVIQ